MAYQSEQTTAQTPSLMRDSEALNEKLRDLIAQVSKIADTMYGSVPTPVNSSKEPSPVPTLQRSIESAHMLINHLENEIRRIEERL